MLYAEVWPPPVTVAAFGCRNIMDHSFLKVYHKDPAHVFSHNARPTNGDGRMHREMLYGGREGQLTLRQQPMSPPAAHPMAGTLPPNAGLSMPPSPSRIPYGPRGGAMPGNATLPRDRLSSVPPNRSVSPCPSAILERRDVKPDEDVSNKGVALVRGEGLYADPYLMHEGRLSIASSHSGHPGDVPDHGMGGFHRASVRSNSSYASSDGAEHHSLYRQKSRKYGDSQLPTLGSKTPPPSPHRMADVRLVDIHPVQGAHIPPQGVPMERGSPVRQSFRKDSSGGMETVTKARSNMASPVIPDLPMGQGDRPPHAMSSNDPQTRDKMVKRASPVHSANSGGASPILAAKSSAESSPTPPPLAAPAPLQANLAHFRKNVSDLRLQLLQMRQLQLQNQETLKLMVKRAEQEISGKLVEAVKRLEDPAQRQRVLVEEDRHKYLSMEERVLVQLGELEQYVDELKKDSASGAVQRAVTLKDVEEGAVGLRKVGESLAGLKGEFPALQTKMRAVLRVEVEAVKFLKEEPHKLDSMLKRVKNLTETLSSLRRLVTDGPLKGSESLVVRETSAVAVVESEPPPSAVQDSSPPSSASPTGLPEPQSSSIRSEVMPASPLVIHHAQSSPVLIQQSLQSAALVHQPSPPLTPSQERHSPTLAKISTPTMGNSPALSKKPVLNPEPPPSVAESNSSAPQNLLIEEVHNSREKSKQRAKSIEAAEKEWAERRQNMGQYDGKEFDKILQEAQANMMKGIPSLEVGEEEAPTAPPAVQGDEMDTPQPVESPPKEAPVPESSPEKPVQPSPEPRALSSPPPVAEKPAKILPEKPAKPSLDKVAKLNAEKACKSPPPPPPRRNYPPGSGLTTGRSGEVIFTSRKESVSAQEGEEEAAPPQPPKPSKIPPEIKPKPQTPPPIVASAICDEEDEGDKIMAELQNSELQREEKESHTDENGNDTMRQSPGVIYYVTAQISKEQQPSPGAEDQPERKEAPVSPSQVANVNAFEISQRQQQLVADKAPVISALAAAAESQPSPPAARRVAAACPPSEGPGAEAQVPSGSPVPREEAAEPASPALTPGKQVVAPPIQEIQVPPVAERPPPLAEPSAPPSLISGEDSGCFESPPDSPDSDYGDQLVLGSSKARVRYVEEYTSLSPDLPGDEGPPPPDNIAFMITNTKVQALSCGEYQEIVNTRGEAVQTVTVDDDRNMMAQDDNGFNKKPVIIIFDEPMDIRSAYKRLSTIFESEEELERMLSEERIEEENEEAEEELDPERHGLQVKSAALESDRIVAAAHSRPTEKPRSHRRSRASREPSAEPAEEAQTEPTAADDGKQDAKKKFKFKFPKKQLAALTQAIRTGTKTGKKTLQVVVYEEEEEPDGTLKQQKEAKRFEIGRTKSQPLPNNGAPPVPPKPGSPPAEPSPVDSHCRTDEIRKSTYKTLDSLEQTIKQLENTISEMGPRAAEEAASEESRAYSVQVGGPAVREAAQTDVPSPKGARSLPSLPNKAPLRKKPKPQLLPRPAVVPANTTATTAATTSEQNTSVASSASRMPVPVSAKSRQPPGGTEKAGKQQKLQDPQRQFRQTQNGRTSSSSSSSSSSCSPSPLSPLSPTSLGQGAKSIRTIHTPSFTSYKPHNGSKSTIPSASSSKDTA